MSTDKPVNVCFKTQVVEMRVYDNGDTVYLFRPPDDAEITKTTGCYPEIVVRFKPNEPTPFRAGDIVDCQLTLADKPNPNEVIIRSTRVNMLKDADPYTSIYMKGISNGER